MLDPSYRQPFGDSSWTIYEARSVLPRLAEISEVEDETQAAEHFLALCGYLDQLGGAEFDRLPPSPVRGTVAVRIQQILQQHPSGSLDRLEGEDDLDDLDLAGIDIDTVVRLDQPVNSALTLAEGRDLGERLATTSGWQADLGQALIALYRYLDELHGGTGQFTELLSTAERAEVWSVVSPLLRG